MDKPTFVKIMDAIVEQTKRHDQVWDTLYELLGISYPDSSPFNDLVADIVIAIEMVLEPDVDQTTLSWWLWEVEGWKKPDVSYATDADGKPIYIRNTGELYDLITTQKHVET